MKKIILLCCFGIMSQFTYAQTNKVLEFVPNYDFNANPLFDGVNLSESTGVWEVFRNIRSISVTDAQLAFDIVGGITLSFAREASFITSDNVLVWNGNSSTSAFPNATIALSVEEGVIRGLITRGIDNAPLGISFIGNSHYVLFEDVQLNDTYPPMSNLAQLETAKQNAAARIATTCDGMVIYRLIIAYTPEFANSFPAANRQAAVNNFLVGVIDNVNETYERSGVNVRARLAFSYQTPDSESYSFTHNLRSFLFPEILGMYSKYDEIFAYKIIYGADASILLISDNHDGNNAGSASEDLDMGIYHKSGAIKNFGVAHEIGHMFGLEHNREEYSWWSRKINGVSWALDNKKAYGFRGIDYRTVMSYKNNNQKRVNFYADENDVFPDGQPAGDSYAKAREFLSNHLNWVVGANDPSDYNVNNRQIASSQMVSLFAYSTVQVGNFIVNSNARVHLKAQERITFGPGTVITTGSDLLAQVVPCRETAGFRVAAINPTNNPKLTMNFGSSDPITETKREELTVYPNPVSYGEDLQIEYNFSDEDVTFTLYNTDGVEIYRIQASHAKKITYNIKLPSGLYLAKIQTKKGNFLTKKILTK